MRMRTVYILAWCVLAIIVLVALTACAPNYSTGSRVGVVTKLSEKGVLWKSWEGEMLVALPAAVAGTTQPEKFEFNVAPEAVAAVTAATAHGQRVELVYRQWLLQPLSVENDHVVIGVRPTQ